MKAKAAFYYSDSELVEKAELMGLPLPEPRKRVTDIYFSIDLVEIAYLGEEGIVLWLKGRKRSWIIEYNKEIWERIKKYMENK